LQGNNGEGKGRRRRKKRADGTNSTVASGKENSQARVLLGHKGGVAGVAFSKDGEKDVLGTK